MRVAALYDVHGNLPALEAALEDVDEAEVDLLLSGGDLLLGPQPSDCLELLRKRGAAFIRGNCDRTVVNGADRDDPWLGPVLFCHGSPRSDEEIITAITPPKRLDPILDGVLENVIVCGHTHVQFDRTVGDRRLVNAGSVGLPYEGEPGIAPWALLGPGVELRRARYDAQLAVEALDTSGYPDDDGQVRGFLLEPSSAEEATAHFETAATS
jgi:putative phosphoesterase